jgi:hypothetical protein
VEGLEEKEMSKMTSRSAATMHDEQNHAIQRRCARESIGSSPLILQWDEGSKRKKAWCVTTLVAAREQSDGSRMREVLGAKPLLTDWDDGGKKKSGKNVAGAVLGSLLEFLYPEGQASEPASTSTFVDSLHNVAFMLSDFTSSNSGNVNGAAAILRRSIQKACGHMLIFHAPCLSHVVHNECAIVVSSFGNLERTAISHRKKKRDEDGLLTVLPALIPAIIDDIVFAMERFPGILCYLARQEGRAQLGAPVVGVETRWAYLIDGIEWLQPMGRCTPLPSIDEPDAYTGTFTGRLDRMINYMIDQSKQREYAGEPDSKLGQSINEIADTDIRELLHELSKPRVRLALAIFELYGTGGASESDNSDDDDSGDDDDAGDAEGDVSIHCSARKFLYFTEDDHEGVFFRVHRRARRRIEHMKKLAAKDEDDGGEYYEQACRQLIEYVESSDGAFDELDVREEVRVCFAASLDFFMSGKDGASSSPGTEFLFRNPIYLAPGMLDEKGGGVCTAQELVALAGGQDPLMTLSQLIAEYLHASVTATEVKDAIESHSDSPAQIFLPDAWELVVAYSKMDEDTLMKNEPTLQPLYDTIFRVYRFLPVGNFFSETVVKTLVKTLHPTQRRLEATASRWVAALHRDPARLARLTGALVTWARGVLGHSKRRRIKAQAEIPTVDTHGSILGVSSEIDVPTVLAPEDDGGDDNDEGGEADEDDDDDDDEEEELEATVLAAMQTDHIEVIQRQAAAVHSNLLVGLIIALTWGGEGHFFLAQVTKLPKSARAWTFQVRWLDEVENGIYQFDQRWPKSSAKLRDVVDLKPPIYQLSDGKWHLSVKPAIKPAAAEPSAAEPASAKPASAEPASAKPTAAKQAITKPAAKAAKPATAAAGAKPAAAAKPAATAAKDASAYLSEVGALLTGVGRLRSDRPILTRCDDEWLNDCQIANDNELYVRPYIKYLYPLPQGMAASCLRGARHRQATDGTLHEKYCVLMPYSVNQLHWHTLIMCYADKTGYHFEGFGNVTDDEVAGAFQPLRAYGWRLVAIRFELQGDTSSCGVWLQVARDAYIAYVDSNELGTRAFAGFLERWLNDLGVVRRHSRTRYARASAKQTHADCVLLMCASGGSQCSQWHLRSASEDCKQQVHPRAARGDACAAGATRDREQAQARPGKARRLCQNNSNQSCRRAERRC